MNRFLRHRVFIQANKCGALAIFGWPRTFFAEGKGKGYRGVRVRSASLVKFPPRALDKKPLTVPALIRTNRQFNHHPGPAAAAAVDSMIERGVQRPAPCP